MLKGTVKQTEKLCLKFTFLKIYIPTICNFEAFHQINL